MCDRTYNSIHLLQQHFNTNAHIKTSNKSPLSNIKFPIPSSITDEHFIEDPLDNHFMEKELKKNNAIYFDTKPFFQLEISTLFLQIE